MKNTKNVKLLLCLMLIFSLALSFVASIAAENEDEEFDAWTK